MILEVKKKTVPKMGRDGLVFVNVRKDIVKLKRKQNLAEAPFMEHGKGTTQRWSHCLGCKSQYRKLHTTLNLVRTQLEHCSSNTIIRILNFEHYRTNITLALQINLRYT